MTILHCYQSLIVEEDVLGNVELAESEAAVPHHCRVLPDRHHSDDHGEDHRDDYRDDHGDDHYVEGEGAGGTGGGE